MNDIIRLIVYMLIGLAGAFVVLYLFAWGTAQTERSEDLRQAHDVAMIEEDAEEIQLLKLARMYPFGSPEQDKLMDEYKRVNQRHEAAQAQRRTKIVDARMQGK